MDSYFFVPIILGHTVYYLRYDTRSNASYSLISENTKIYSSLAITILVLSGSLVSNG